MTDTPEPSDRPPASAAQNESPPGAPSWAAGVSGPAGWPGEVLSSAMPTRALPAEAPDAYAADAPRHAPESFPPRPEPQRVDVVEAVPLSRAESRGPSIRVEAEPHAPRTDAPRSEPPRDAPPSPPPGAPPPPSQGTAPVYEGKRTWAVLAHLAYLVPLPPHIAGLVITIVIWAWRRRRDAFVEDQGREALNFQLLYTGLNFVLCGSCFFSWMVPFVWIVGAVLCIVGAVRAGDGVRFRYPYIFRLVQ